jgi:hypothetical protein
MSAKANGRNDRAATPEAAVIPQGGGVKENAGGHRPFDLLDSSSTLGETYGRASRFVYLLASKLRRNV